MLKCGQANTVHFTITLDFANFVLTGQAGSTFAFNIVGNPTISFATATLPGWSLDSPNAGNLQADGFGNFGYSLNCCNGQQGSGNSQAAAISFDIISTTALSPQDFQKLSSGASPVVFFALDIFSNTTGNTGFVGANTVTTAIPEPSSLLLFGSGISGFVFWSTLRRFRK
jgi:hypothetical protein